MKKLLVSIVIATNSKNPQSQKFLSHCLSSIKKNTSISHEVIVEDGAKIGPAKARNIAANRARGKYLFFLDYDTLVVKNWLKNVVAYLDKHASIGGGQLKLLRMDRPKIFDSAGEKLTPFGFLVERAQEAEDHGQFDKVEPIFSCKGAAMIVRKYVFEKVGGFDEDYFMYWEEPDLTWQIWKAGYKFVFLPMGTVYHAYGTKNKPVLKEWDKQITYLGCRNQLMTIVKNAVGWSGVRILGGAIVGWLGLLGLFGLRRDLAKVEAILSAFGWLLLHPRLLWRKRRENKERLGSAFYSDAEWLKKVTDRRRIEWYMGKGLAYISGRPF